MRWVAAAVVVALLALGLWGLWSRMERIGNARLVAEAGALGSAVSQADADATFDRLRGMDGISIEEAGKIVNIFGHIDGITVPIMAEMANDTPALAQRMRVSPACAARWIAAAYEFRSKPQCH